MGQVYNRAPREGLMTHVKFWKKTLKPLGTSDTSQITYLRPQSYIQATLHFPQSREDFTYRLQF